MKNLMFLVLVALSATIQAQQAQFHYDFRHTLNPEQNSRDFPSLTFEYFKGNDTTSSFLLKMQADFTGENTNVGQLFLQLSQSFRYWEPPVYLSLNYSGGLGVAPPSYGYYISNSFGAGIAYPFQWDGAWLSASLMYRYNAFPKGSHDAQLNFYFWKGFFNYKMAIAGSLVAWSENRNQGTDFTKELSGKKVAFFGDPQIWVKVLQKVSVGSRVNVFYHVLTPDNRIQVYPTLAVKREF